MSDRVAAGGVDVDELMRQVRAAIAEKKRGLVSEEELREIAERPLEPVLDAHDFKSDLLAELLADPTRWNYSFGPDALVRSSRGAVGRALEAVRRALRPVQKLFWNPTPLVSALSRQSDLNTTYVHLLHNMAVALTRQHLEIHDLENRLLQLQGRLDLQARREKALEGLLGGPERRAGGGEGGAAD
ncbi:MAG TPA: hypothetical protein VMT87_00710 [Vicinamibacteria bacterium]|nr:hypothetical protein [Vicinamibacteria bacterium]